jgi:hypothetical protein
MGGLDGDGSQSLSPPGSAPPYSSHSSDNPPASGRASQSSDTSKPKNTSRGDIESTDVRGLAASNSESSSVGRPSPSTFRETLPDEPFNTAPGGDLAATSGRDSRTRDPRTAENRTIGIPAAASSSHKTTVASIDKTERDVGRSRVSTHIVVVLTYVILTQ